MVKTRATPFDVVGFLTACGLGKNIIHFKSTESFFVQGSPAAAVFYLETGRVKLTVVSKRGKEATITLLKAGDFVGEEAIAGIVGIRIATATAITNCTAMRIEREAMAQVLHDETAFNEVFMKYILLRGIRTQEDLIDQLFNSSEKRLARTLLLMAEFGKAGEPETRIPPITQEALADMIGTTRSRVSHFMNRFRKLGYIEYNGRIHVNRSLLNVVLQDQLPEENTSKPLIVSSVRHPLANVTPIRTVVIKAKAPSKKQLAKQATVA